MTRTIEDLKRAQKATHKITDQKKARAEFDRYAGLIAAAQHQAAYEASQEQGRAEEARRQADIDLRKRNLETLTNEEATLAELRKESAGVRDDIVRLEARIAKVVTGIPQIGRNLQELDGEDYSRFADDWYNALTTLIGYHRNGGKTHQHEPVEPLDEALNRVAGRIAYAKKHARLPA